MSRTESFTILDEGRATEVTASIDGTRTRIAAADLERALGWQLKPEGFCKAGVCVPASGAPGVVEDGSVDLARLAELLHTPAAIDLEARAAAFGVPASDRAAAMATLQAPDFRLPDLAGDWHSLSGHRGKKVLLIAHASW